MSDNLIKTEFIDFEYDQIERVEKIKKLLEESRNAPSHAAIPVNFMNRVCDLEMVYVPIGLLMYRLENGRTLSLQDEHLAINQDLPEDFFTRDDNSPEAQSVQHELLMKLSEIKDILATFRDTVNKQTEPLIITNTGFVVNGNRRLSCWRHLYFEDRVTYNHFEYIRVAVLPEADENAIDKLEADLQIAPDIKADYLWHAEARMMQKRIEERREKIEDVATLYRMSKKDVEERIEMLQYAREYLRRNNWDRQWSKVDQGDFTFRPLVKERKKLNDPVEKSIFESLTFSTITAGSSGVVEGRIYERIPEIRRHLNPIVEAIRDELPEIIEKNTPSEGVGLLLDEFADSEQDTTDVAKALVTISLEDQIRVAEVAESVIFDEKAKERERKNANYLVDQVKKASIALKNAVDASDEDNNVTEGLEKLLDMIDENLKKLKAWLSEYENTN